MYYYSGMNFINLYKDIATCENVGFSNCDTAEDTLEMWVEKHPDLKPDADATALNIAQVRASIPILGDRLRSNIRQFAVLCRDTDLEAYLKEVNDATFEHFKEE